MAPTDILLGLMPFWTPQIPPLGICSLKGYLGRRGYRVKILDANTDVKFKQLYNEYFDTLRVHLPEEQWGNFYNTGHDVLQHHLMVHLLGQPDNNGRGDNNYTRLLKEIIYQHFFQEADPALIARLEQIASRFYACLGEYVTAVLSTEKSGVLGLSVYGGNLAASLFAFRLVREKHPGIRTIMGGGVFADQLHVNSPDFRLFQEQTPYIDTIVVGEGEQLLLRCMRGEIPVGQRVVGLQDMGGETLELAGAPPPDFSDLHLDYYPHLTAYASRSCPYQCTFCSETMQWGRFRKKAARQIADELVGLYRTHGRQLFLLGDSLLNPVADGLARELTASGTVVYWDGYLRVEPGTCQQGNTILWRRGGFYRARLGIESGSPEVLEKMGKSITPDQVKTTVTNLATAGIKTTTYWVVGYPGERESDFQATLQLVETLKDSIYEAECNPFRYFLTGQVNSARWQVREKQRPLYGKDADHLLLPVPMVLEGEPPRQETYSRLRRFVAHCQRLGIPNPYSLQEIARADARWLGLSRNAVPPLLSFSKKGVYIDECRRVQPLTGAQEQFSDDGDWGF